MVAKNLEVGDLVWAKMKGFPAWPARIIEPPAKASKPKKAHHYVYFFGSDNHAWIMDDNIVPHTDSMLEEASNKKRSPALQHAIEAIMNYNKNNVKKDKPSTHKADKADGHVAKDSSKSKSPQIINNVTKKRENKVSKKIQPSKKVTVLKINKKTPRKRPSFDESNNNIGEPVSPKRNRVTNDDYSSLLNSVPPNVSYTHIPSYDDHVSAHPSPSILGRPAYVERQPTPPLDIETISETLKTKHVTPTEKKVGFLGLGIMGRGIVKNLLNSGHHVTVWNRTPAKMENFIRAGAHRGMTPADVVIASDITFCCVSDPEAAKSLVFGNCGVLKALETCGDVGKGYVEMTSIDPDTSREIAEAISTNGGKYLEAPINGSKKQAEEGTLFILAAGDRALFADCETCFHAMGNHAYYISCEVGNGSKMNLILSMLLGTTYAALSEAMALIERAKLSQDDFLEILTLGSLHCPALIDKGHSILVRNFSTNTPLKHMQKDLNLALIMGNELEQPMPIAAATNEVYKHAKLLRYSDHDVCSVYMGAKY
ncbi:putative oxidoreductase GLYR1-like protein, partial [Stegodyphus mimosarum]